MTLTQQLRRIENDILLILSKHDSLTQEELYKLRGNQLKSISEYGWSFALENLERRHEVESYVVLPNPNYKWKLKNPERKSYIKEVEEFTSKKVSNDM